MKINLLWYLCTKPKDVGVNVNRWKIVTLSNMSPLNSKPLPGLTCFNRLTISSPPPFSWATNICQNIFKYPPTTVLLRQNIYSKKFSWSCFTWWPNWLEGKERTARSPGNCKKTNVGVLQYLEYKLWAQCFLRRIHIGSLGMCTLWVGYTLPNYSYWVQIKFCNDLDFCFF